MPIILGLQLPPLSLFVLCTLGIKSSLDQAPRCYSGWGVADDMLQNPQAFSKAPPPPISCSQPCRALQALRCPQVATVPWGLMTAPQWLGSHPQLGTLGVHKIYGLPWGVGDCRGTQNLGLCGDPFGAWARARREAVSSSRRGPGHWGQGSGGEGRCILQLVTSARSKCRLIYRVRLGLERGSLAGSAMSHRQRGQSGGRDCTPPRSFSQLRRSRGMRPLPALPPGDREAAEGACSKHTLPAPPQARRLGPGVQRTAPSPLASL